MESLMEREAMDALEEWAANPVSPQIQQITELRSKMEAITPGLADNFRHVQDEQFMLFLKKNLDYGSKNITAGLELKNPEEVKFVLNGLWYRISDKVNRWRNIQMKGQGEVSDETLLDIFQDIANYACISSLVARGLWKS